MEITKFFSSEKLLKNSFLNFCGIHLLRIFIARIFYYTRQKIQVPKHLVHQKDKLNKDGYILIENFLNNDDFSTILTEVEKIKSIHTPKILTGGNNGNAVWKRTELTEYLKKNNSSINSLFLKNKNFVDLIKIADGKKYKLNYLFYDEVSIDINSSEIDASQLFHSDTFFNTHKIWFFLEDVNMNNGPFTIKEGSHKLSLKRILFEYLNSIFYKKNTDSPAIENSNIDFNFTEKSITCKKNSLLIANTFSFHRRGEFDYNKVRKAIHFYYRSNPFLI